MRAGVYFVTGITVKPPVATTSYHAATSFPKYQKFPRQITIFGTPCKRPRPFLELKV